MVASLINHTSKN